jgi:hypothetical protein
VTTDAGRFTLHGNDIRFALRSAGGEILASTYFSVDAAAAGDGRLARVTLRGHGNGHGVGMCQWGAVGRARAPGTTSERSCARTSRAPRSSRRSDGARRRAGRPVTDIPNQAPSRCEHGTNS